MQAIFLFLPDIASLKSIRLTCSSFYCTYADAESVILNGILCSQIGSAMMPMALILSKAYDIPPWSEPEVLDYLSHLHEYRARKLPMMWTFPNALRVSQLHYHVEYFANDFATEKLASEAQPRPSIQEEHRIQRTLYLWELFCILYRTQSQDPFSQMVSVGQRRGILFPKFAPWEHEQMACIHEYIETKLKTGMCF